MVREQHDQAVTFDDLLSHLDGTKITDLHQYVHLAINRAIGIDAHPSQTRLESCASPFDLMLLQHYSRRSLVPARLGVPCGTR